MYVCTTLCLCLCVYVSLPHSTQYSYLIMKVQVRVRSALVCAVFRRALDIHPESSHFFSGGQVTNLFSGARHTALTLTRLQVWWFFCVCMRVCVRLCVSVAVSVYCACV